MLADIEAVSSLQRRRSSNVSTLLKREGLSSLPPEYVEGVRDNAVSLWKRCRLICGLKQIFWQVWSRNYVMDLQAIAKWHQDMSNLEVGQIVNVHKHISMISVPEAKLKTAFINTRSKS